MLVLYIEATRSRTLETTVKDVKTFADRGLSGASHTRPGYQDLLSFVREGGCDVVVAESIDRLSRDQEHIAGFYKAMAFQGVVICTVAEGVINELHIGLKSTMSALYLKDLAQKTKRGLEGRVAKGKSGGGTVIPSLMLKRIDLAFITPNPLVKKQWLACVQGLNVPACESCGRTPPQPLLGLLIQTPNELVTRCKLQKLRAGARV